MEKPCNNVVGLLTWWDAGARMGRKKQDVSAELISLFVAGEASHQTLSSVGKELLMDAILGRYRARMEETGLILRHASGINFDLTPEETLALLNFLHAYRQTLLVLCHEDGQGETEPRLEKVVLDKSEPEAID